MPDEEIGGTVDAEREGGGTGGEHQVEALAHVEGSAGGVELIFEEIVAHSGWSPWRWWRWGVPVPCPGGGMPVPIVVCGARYCDVSAQRGAAVVLTPR